MDAIREALLTLAKDRHIRDGFHYAGRIKFDECLHPDCIEVRELTAAPEQTELRERLEAALDKFIPIYGGYSTHFNAEHRKGILDAIMPILAALPLLPQPAAPPSEDDRRFFVHGWIEKHIHVKNREAWILTIIHGIVADFSRKFPPTPLRLSREEIVKRGDAKTCHWCQLEKQLVNGRHLQVGEGTDEGWTFECTGRGTAIYELVCEAVGQKS